MGYGDRINITTKSFILSDVLIGSNDTSASTASAAFNLLKTFTIVHDVYPITSLRIKHSLQRTGGGGVSHSRIYRNGVAIGIDHSEAGGPTEYTEDFNFTNLKVHDTISIYAYNTGGGNAVITNFRIYGTETIFVPTLV